MTDFNQILGPALGKQKTEKSGVFILFLDKMVNPILSCAYRAGRQWRREKYGLRFLAAMPLTAWQRSHKTAFNRFMKN